VRARASADAQLAWRLASARDASSSSCALAAPLARALAEASGDEGLRVELLALALLLSRAGGAPARDALADALARRACEGAYGDAGAAGVLAALAPLLALHPGTHPLGRAPEGLLDACCRALRSPQCAVVCLSLSARLLPACC
jgi:hypothetical protein